MPCLLLQLVCSGPDDEFALLILLMLCWMDSLTRLAMLRMFGPQEPMIWLQVRTLFCCWYACTYPVSCHLHSCILCCMGDVAPVHTPTAGSASQASGLS